MLENKESEDHQLEEKPIPEASSNDLDEQDRIIDFSKRVISTLEDKSQAHNEEHPSNATSLTQLKKVFYSGAKKSPKENPENVNVYAMARVNMFLRTKATQDFKEILISGAKEEKTDEIKLEKLSCAESEETQINAFIDISSEWFPNDQDFELAEQDVKENDLSYVFSNINELYIDFEGEALGISVDYL